MLCCLCHNNFGGNSVLDHLTDREFDRTCIYLSHMFGLDMRTKRVLLDCRLSRERDRLGLRSFSAYLDLIEEGTDPEASSRFVDLVTTHYTYFMRETRQFDFLRSTAFPELERTRPIRTWNILCAGCSTGEECYSVSMLVEDYERNHTIPQVRISGVDVSEPALREAREAVYPASRVDKVPSRWLSSYFERKDGDFAVSDRIRRRVSFSRANLAEPEGLKRSYDLILCRNVIIYFDERSREKALAQLHRRLAPSRYLVLGHAEIVHDRTLFAYRGNSIYQKQSEAIQP